MYVSRITHKKIDENAMLLYVLSVVVSNKKF